MITILMAVYNGEKYLSDQIESILAQTAKEWKLVLQDDCSTDATAEIAKLYEKKYPDKISFSQRITPSGSAKDNFFSMIKYADTEYLMTCDQDDIWLPQKIEITLEKITEIEKRAGVNTPVLVHTDLRVVDSQLKNLSNSLFKYQNFNKNNDKLNNLIVQNIVTGCTMMVNRALITKLQKEPEYAIMHDWWFALIAAAFGCIDFIDEPTVLYRQHSNNEVGAKKVNSLSYVIQKAVSIIRSPIYTRKAIYATYKQAESFLNVFRDDIPDEKLQILLAYASIPNVKKNMRLNLIFTHKFWKHGLLRKIGQIILV